MFHDSRSASFSTVRPERQPSLAQEAAGLLARYPNLGEIELARLINLYRSLSALDVALMISDEQLSPKLDLFFHDHRSQVRTPFRQYAALIAIAVVGIIVTVWAVAFGT